MTKNVVASAVAKITDDSCLSTEHNFTELDVNFKRNKISNFEYLIESKESSFFQLQLFEVNESENLIESILEKNDTRMLSKSFFIISEKLKNWVPILLSKGVFDVMIAPIRKSELIGKLEFFFSSPFQTNLLKSSYYFQFELTKKEQKLFDFLIDHPQGVTREQLMTICWKNITVHPKTLDVHLFNLRQKIESVGGTINFRNGMWLLSFCTKNFSKTK